MFEEYLINYTATLQKAAKQLNNHHRTLTLFVRDKNDRIVGIFTAGDLRRAVIRLANLRKPVRLEELKVCDYMQGMFKSATLGEPILQKIAEAQEKRFRLLPILDDDKKLVNILDLTVTTSRPPIDVAVMSGLYDHNLELAAKKFADRRKIHDRVTYDRQYKRYLALTNIDHSEFNFLFSSGKIDELYCSLVRGKSWAEEVTQLRSHDNMIENLIKALDEKKRELLEYYIDTLANSKNFGESEDICPPEFIVILGCKDTNVMKQRVEAAVELIKNQGSTTIVLSGGRRGSRCSESQFMQQYLAKFDSLGNNTVLVEEDSLDTVGNAILTKLLLMSQNKLRAGQEARLVVFTSSYHAPRSLRLFRTVFAPASVVVHAVPPGQESKKKDLIKLASGQLDSEHKAARTVFAIENYITGETEAVKLGSTPMMFYRLLTQHKLYRDRYDLFEKYKVALGKLPNH